MKKLMIGLMFVGVVGMSAAYAADSQDATTATDTKGLQNITIAEADAQQPAVTVSPAASEEPKKVADAGDAATSMSTDATATPPAADQSMDKPVAKKHHKKHMKHKKHHKHHKKNKSQSTMQSTH